MTKLASILKTWSVRGMYLPLAYDKQSNGPSVTLFFVWLSGIISCIASISLMFTDKTLTAAFVSISFWALAVVFYRLRKLDSFKLDLDDKTIELNGDDNEKID